MIERLAIVGLGLLGGSLAKAARTRGLAREIVAIGRRRESVAPALADGTVNRIDLDVASGVAGADVVVLATPVTTLVEQLPAVWAAAADGALVTDVGSTKGRIVAVAEQLGARRPLAFVGSHPMAGSHLGGYGVSHVDLFQGARVVLTPTERTLPEATRRARALWEAVGGQVTVLDPATHDRAVAAISHLPHLVADALVDAVLRMDPAFLDVAARGFKDTTRIAASVPTVWTEIFQDNRVALGETLAAFRKSLDHLEALIGAGDSAALQRELARIRDAREALG